MKKLGLFIGALLFGCNISFAQVSNYAFAVSNPGSYTTISGTGTGIIASSGATNNYGYEIWSASKPIGFNFTFGCNTYTTFQANCSGVLTLGTAFTTAANGASWDVNNLGALPNAVPTIAPLWGDMNSADGVYYQLSGVSPNQVLTVEWHEMYWNSNATGYSVDFQLKLFQTTNVIEFIYKVTNSGDYDNPTASIGIANSTGFLSLDNGGAAPTASSAVSTNNIASVTNDEMYTFTPGSCNTITPGAITGAPFNLTGCTGTAAGTIAFTSAGTFNAGNIYTAYLSNASGSFASQVSIGTLSSTGNAGTINVTIPGGTPAGTGYEIQIVSSTPSATSTATAPFTITESGCSITAGVVTGSPFNLGNCTTSGAGSVAFTSVGTFAGGNVFTAYLSTDIATFPGTAIGTLSSSGVNPSGSIPITIPAGTIASNYEIEIISSNGVVSSVTALIPVNGCTSCGGAPADQVIVQYNSDTYSGSLASITGTQSSVVSITPLSVSAATTDYCGAGFTACSYYQITGTNTGQSYCSGTTPSITTAPDYFYFTVTPNAGYVLNMTDIYLTCGAYGGGSSGATSVLMGYQDGANPWVASSVFTYAAGTGGGGSSGSGIPAAVTVPGGGCAPMNLFHWTLAPAIYTANTVTVKFIPFNATTCNCSTDEFGFTQVQVDGPCSPVVLPCQLVLFTANYQPDNSIQVKWETATEINSDYFGVEYSLDGETFIPYTKVKAVGNSDATQNYYTPFTLDIGNQTPYFRLKMVDNNGKFAYSKTITLGNTAPNVALAVINTYYNSADNSIVTHFTLDVTSQIGFTLYDISGREVYTTSNQFNRGANEFSIPAPDVSGVYILVYQNGSSAPVRKKVVVTK